VVFVRKMLESCENRVHLSGRVRAYLEGRNCLVPVSSVMLTLPNALLDVRTE
jgi:hypothetical protein